MRIYFDTNIYDFISDKQEDQAVRHFLDMNKYTVQASSDNLLELYAIPDHDRCIQQLITLTTVAESFEPKPQSWWQAREVISEIRNLKHYWLRDQASQKLILQEKNFINGHLINWENAKRSYIPQLSVQAPYRKDSEAGIRKSIQIQKTIRQRLLENELTIGLASQNKNGDVNELISGKLLEPESYWRIDCLIVWFEAIARRIPESRDYADWLLPYIKETAFKSHSYTNFWIEQVRADKVGKNRISSLVNFYQMKHKVTHGNPNDQMHACHLLDVDVFVTADKTFYKVLVDVKTHFRNCGEIILLNRQASSAVVEITNSLSS